MINAFIKRYFSTGNFARTASSSGSSASPVHSGIVPPLLKQEYNNNNNNNNNSHVSSPSLKSQLNSSSVVSQAVVAAEQGEKVVMQKRRTRRSNQEKETFISESPNALTLLTTELVQSVKQVHVDQAQLLLHQAASDHKLRIKFFTPILNALQRSKSFDSLVPFVRDLDVHMRAAKTGRAGHKFLSSVIQVLGRSGDIEMTRKWMQRLNKTKIDLNNVHALIQALSIHGKFDEAYDMVAHMETQFAQHLTPNVESFHMLIECGDKYQMALAWREMRRRQIEPDEAIFAKIITTLCRQGELELAVGIYRHMHQRGLLPTRVDIVECLVVQCYTNGSLSDMYDIFKYYEQEQPAQLKKAMKSVKLANGTAFHKQLAKTIKKQRHAI